MLALVCCFLRFPIRSSMPSTEGRGKRRGEGRKDFGQPYQFRDCTSKKKRGGGKEGGVSAPGRCFVACSPRFPLFFTWKKKKKRGKKKGEKKREGGDTLRRGPRGQEHHRFRYSHHSSLAEGKEKKERGRRKREGGKREEEDRTACRGILSPQRQLDLDALRSRKRKEKGKGKEEKLKKKKKEGWTGRRTGLAFIRPTLRSREGKREEAKKGLP